MLQSINDKAKGWLAYTIVGFIAIPFALFGISSYLEGGGGSLTAASVNGEEVPVQQVQNIVLQQRQRLSQLFGGKLPPGMNEDVIKKQAVDQVVNEVLIRQEAEKNGYRASNQEVYDTISEFPAFQKNGQFDAQTYEQLLSTQRRSKGEFEAQIRDSISNQQFTNAVTNAAFVPTELALKYQGLQNQLRSFETFTLKKEDYADQVSVSNSEIESDYKENAKKYMTEEKVKLSYVLLDQDVLAKNLDIDEEALKLFYDENESRYIEPEKRRIAHLVVNIADDKKEEAKAKAQALLDKIKSGESTFETLVKASSDEKESAENNGEIGLIGRGEQGVLFDEVAFSPALLEGSMTDVVETESGYEIIKIKEIVPSKTKSFEKVKSEVEALYRSEEAEKAFLDQTDKLQTLSFENDTSLDEAADSVGIELQTSDWIARSSSNQATSDNPLSSAKAVSAAFSDEVLSGGKNSELIEIDAKRVLVLRLQDHQRPKQKELSSVSDQIKTLLTTNKLQTLLLEKGESALNTLTENGSWGSIASLGATADNISASPNTKRNDAKQNPQVLSKVFSMEKSAEGKQTFANAVLADGDYVLISLSEVVSEGVEIDPALQQSYSQSLAAREQAAVISALREKADIELFIENIQ